MKAKSVVSVMGNGSLSLSRYERALGRLFSL